MLYLISNHFLLFISFFLDELSLPTKATDALPNGTYIKGHLKNLGWAVYRGCDIPDSERVFTKLDKFATTNWSGLKKDSNRKYSETMSL